jgi:hypothetical protein
MYWFVGRNNFVGRNKALRGYGMRVSIPGLAD